MSQISNIAVDSVVITCHCWWSAFSGTSSLGVLALCMPSLLSLWQNTCTNNKYNKYKNPQSLLSSVTGQEFTKESKFWDGLYFRGVTHYFGDVLFVQVHTYSSIEIIDPVQSNSIQTQSMVLD
jgi:hypothetical protein